MNSMEFNCFESWYGIKCYWHDVAIYDIRIISGTGKISISLYVTTKTSGRIQISCKQVFPNKHGLRLLPPPKKKCLYKGWTKISFWSEGVGSGGHHFSKTSEIQKNLNYPLSSYFWSSSYLRSLRDGFKRKKIILMEFSNKSPDPPSQLP